MGTEMIGRTTEAVIITAERGVEMIGEAVTAAALTEVAVMTCPTRVRTLEEGVEEAPKAAEMVVGEQTETSRTTTSSTKRKTSRRRKRMTTINLLVIRLLPTTEEDPQILRMVHLEDHRTEMDGGTVSIQEETVGRMTSFRILSYEL
jgi:hypothetical protein